MRVGRFGAGIFALGVIAASGASGQELGHCALVAPVEAAAAWMCSSGTLTPSVGAVCAGDRGPKEVAVQSSDLTSRYSPASQDVVSPRFAFSLVDTRLAFRKQVQFGNVAAVAAIDGVKIEPIAFELSAWGCRPARGLAGSEAEETRAFADAGFDASHASETATEAVVAARGNGSSQKDDAVLAQPIEQQNIVTANLLAPAPAALASAPGVSATGSPDSALPQEPGVAGVRPSYSWQAYIGYTFIRFYATPAFNENRNGFNYSIQYYYKAAWFGADGEFAAAFGSMLGSSSHFLMGMGGPRARWSAPGNVELWAHGLMGTVHFGPQLAYGGTDAFGYEVGGGVDLNTSHQRLALRLEADMVGSELYSTTQYSPKISSGIVFKF